MPPNVDPDASPNQAITINCEWLAYIRGALKQLLLQSTWATDDAGLDLVQQRVFNLIDLFTECSGDVFLPFICPGDLFSNPEPFGVWSIVDGEGVYSPGLGYVGQTISAGGNDYHGVDVEIVFDNPIILEACVITYDLTPGTSGLSGTNFAIYAYDHTNAAFLPNHIDFASLPSGTSLTFDFGGSSGPTSDIEIAVTSAEYVSGSGGTDGLARLTRLDIAGAAGIPPC